MKSHRMFAVVCTAGLIVAGAGCATGSSSGRTAHAPVMTRDAQTAMTPDQALTRLKEGNRRFVSGASVHHNEIAAQHATAAGQYPFGAIVSCIDSRSIPEVIFDQGIGDLFVPRIAGNYVQSDILGSLEFATKISGAKIIVVVGHTSCGAVKGACDNVELGNLTTVIREIRPAVDAVPGFDSNRTSKNAQFVQEVAEMNVRMTMEKIRRNSPIIRELEDGGQIRIVGAMHDLDTGRVDFMN